ncbi:MAG: thioredoxin domain-containing protein [Pseudomonadota bacterium]
MKRFVIGLVCVAIAAVLCACSNKPCNPCDAEGGIAAVVDGENITMENLNSAAKDQLARIDTEIYQIKKRVLDSLVEEKLIANAAKKKGINVDKFMYEEIDVKSAEPTDEEAKALYDAREGAITKPFDEVKGQIAEYLKQNRKAQARAELLSMLIENAQVEMKLSPPRVNIELGDVPAIGEDDAEVILVEFADYQCSFCKRVRPTIWRLVDEYKGKLRYVFLDFPLSFHREAKKAHEAARCAGDQGKYYEYNRKLFENQSKLEPDDLKKYAKQLNFDTNKFNQCLDSGAHTATVEKMIEKGAKAGVSGTPVFFINGIMLTGARPYESFKELIDMEIKR